MPVVVFNAEEFKAMYPQFTVGLVESLPTEEQMQHAFDVAALLADNTERSRIPYAPERGVETRKRLLYLLVCHLLTLAVRGAAVGALSSATEGSVSASFAVPPLTNNLAWYAQTPCGLTFWQLWQQYSLGGRYVRYCPQ